MTRNNRLVIIAASVSVLILLFSASPGAAQTCSFTNTGLDFGTVDLSSGARVRTTGTFTASCSGTPRRRVRVCANFGSGTGNINPSGNPRYMVGGANLLNYNIFKNGSYNRNRVWGSDVWPYPPRPKMIYVRLNGSGNGSTSVPIRGEIYAGQSGTPAGFYLSSFSTYHTLISYAYRRTNAGRCRVISGLGGVYVPFNVQANVVGACTVSASNLNFGTAGTLTSNVDTTNTISVSCSNLTPYSIGLDGGLSGSSDPTLRKMVNGPSDITYGIYQNSAHTIPWGNTTGTNTISGVGNGTTQNYTAYGRVAVQTTPEPGTYSDTIIVTMTY